LLANDNLFYINLDINCSQTSAFETMDEDDSSDNDRSSSDEESRRAEPEGEGSIANQRKIRVGPQHQVPVPPHDPNADIVLQNPSLVWSPSRMPTQ